MNGNLKARLQRIRDTGKKEPRPQISRVSPLRPGALNPAQFSPGWFPSGFNVFKRTISRDLKKRPPDPFPSALVILVSDLIPFFSARGSLPKIEDLIFFDLETTGLSGGAGTVAFLAAFGRIKRGPIKDNLEITQYLLLDYPGENDFINAVLAEFKKDACVVSYNGKTFDSQILKTRCLMNGLAPPEYFHADLLYPARRLWKRALPDCSQARIETAVLSLDRTGDIPGSMAPDIWFNFLKNREAGPLEGICDHNAKDIEGLACLFAAFAQIAEDPIKMYKQYNCDAESLALRWREFLRHKKSQVNLPLTSEMRQTSALLRTAELLLEESAGLGHLKSLLALAVDAEWRARDPAKALKYAEMALALPELEKNRRDEFLKRKKRLEKKLTYKS
jgi:uncharacterized protein YprB with RNaseH-like and TPR domain